MSVMVVCIESLSGERDRTDGPLDRSGAMRNPSVDTPLELLTDLAEYDVCPALQHVRIPCNTCRYKRLKIT